MHPSPSPTADPVKGYFDSVTGWLPGWLQPVWIILGLPLAGWLVAPQRMVGGLRWTIRWIKTRHAKGDARRAYRRGRFAGVMAAQVSIMSAREDWQDDRYAELEAEVEVHGRQGRRKVRRRRETIRRVPSLSAALQTSTDAIILLEGEPGSGKSVAMRHLAIRLAEEVRKKPSEDGVIPIYVNLKEFRPTGAVDVNAVRTFVKETINRANDHLIEKFVEDEFDRGIEEGTWLFLFDSFDEIPAVLGAVEADDLIDLHATALYEFLNGMGPCRGIIASRDFRGPKRIGWPKFRVLRLTERQQRELIRKLDLPEDVEGRLFGDLAVADPSVRQLADNPLFLALLCEHQRDGRPFPGSSHVVFEAYVAKRFAGDDKRLQRRFAMPAATVRLFAERAAFAMAAEPGLGLSPTRSELLDAVRRQGNDITDRAGAKALDALEYLRLARPVEATATGGTGFTFSHRRFQEYFATCLVLREGTHVDPTVLLTDGRWRETAVTLMHTQSDEALAPLLAAAERLLSDMVEGAVASVPEQGSESRRPFNWPTGALHLLGLLQAGLAHTGRGLPASVRALAGVLLSAAYRTGQLHDRRWATDVVLAADDNVALDILRKAFASGSGWLREAAYAQTGRLTSIPLDLRRQMRRVIAGLAAGGQLRSQRFAIDAQLRRIADSGQERLLKNLFLAAPWFEAALLTVLGVLCAMVTPVSMVTVVSAVVVAHAGLYIHRDASRLDWEQRYSAGRLRWFHTILSTVARVRDPVLVALLGTLVRWMAVWFLTTFIALYWPPRVVPILLVAGFGYALAWGSTAVRADEIVDRLTLWRIPLLPLLVALRLRKEWPEFWALVRKLRWPTLAATRRLLWGGAKGLPAVVLVVGLVWLTSAGPPLVRFIVLAAMLGIVCLAALVAAAVNMRRQWRDNALLHKIVNDRTVTENFGGMLATLTAFRNNRTLLLFVQEIKRGSLAAENRPVLRALCVFAEVSEARLDDPYDTSDIVIRTPLEPDEVAVADGWLSSLPVPSIADQAVLDEIGKIVADVELRRLTTAAAGGHMPLTVWPRTSTADDSVSPTPSRRDAGRRA